MKKSLVLSFIILIICLVPLSVSAQSGGPVYVVEQGDTLSGIARTFGTSVDALMQANGLTNANQLQPGQELVVPGFEGVQGVLTTHRVQFGENLHFLSRQNSADQAALARLNRVLHPGRIYIGQSLILPEVESNSGNDTVGIKPYVVQSGEGLLQYAAAHSLNPWRLALSASGEPRQWWIPGEWVMVPTENRSSSALPAPITELDVSPSQAAQGETVVIRAGVSEPIELRGQLADWQLNFMEAQESELVALQGVRAMIDPGLYELTVDWGDTEGPASGFSQPYPIRSGNYGFDPILYVPEETLGAENTEPEDELIAELLAPATPTKHWEGSFAWPSDHFVESFPSVFGTRRNYNNTSYNAYHTGLDFYGGIGVEVLAPAPGEVVFSDDLVVRGMTTIIDHGWGVYTLYMHQSETMVEVGDRVETGQLIGLVGASGRVTGAHLHWEVRVGGIPVQPLDWIQEVYP